VRRLRGEKCSKADKIREANIRYHTKLSKTYDETQPQYKPENVARVRERVKSLAKATGGGRLLDIGCGTGFILSIAAPFFDEVCGIDITPAMLERARKMARSERIKNIKLIEAACDDAPFPDAHFDVVSAYGVLHHLPELQPTFKEIRRVLKRKGVFYADEDPNYYFWQSMRSLPTDGSVSDVLETERRSVCEMVGEVQNVVGKDLDQQTIRDAEYQKTKGGMKEERIVQLLKRAGFKKIDYRYTWFWQEGRVVRDLSPEDAIYFEDHLRAALPLTRGFFKYVGFEARP
jgi:ubiquinone/menaquinone biosynthesis C-methylase UbiE